MVITFSGTPAEIIEQITKASAIYPTVADLITAVANGEYKL